jgi:hypothetical protein
MECVPCMAMFDDMLVVKFQSSKAICRAIQPLANRSIRLVRARNGTGDRAMALRARHCSAWSSCKIILEEDMFKT